MSQPADADTQRPAEGTGEPETPARPEEYEPDPRRWRALSVTLTAGFMTLLDVSIVSVALPSIQHAFGTSPAEIQWIVSGYALTFGLVLVPAGRLGDAFGRRRMFLGALGGFVVCSALVGIAPNATLLVAARLLQGVAAGCLAPQNTALIQQLFRGAERGRAFGFFGSTVGLSTAIGPVLGGAILALAGPDEGWRWLFLINVPIGVLALVLAARLIPRRDSGRSGGDIDWVGVALLGAGVLSLLFPLVLSDSGGITRFWWLFPIGLALIVAFARWERQVIRRHRAPVLDPRLITDTAGYASGLALGTVYFIGFSGIWIVFALFYQNGLGYTPLQSGLAAVPFAIGAAGSAVIGGRLVERVGRLLTVIGLALVVVSLAVTALVLHVTDPSSAGWAAAGPLLIGGIGGGWVITPNTTLTLREVPVRMAGSAGGALQTGQRLGGAIGTAALAGIFYGVLGSSHEDYQLAILLAIGAAAAFTCIALSIAIWEWRRGVRDARVRSSDRTAGEVSPT